MPIFSQLVIILPAQCTLIWTSKTENCPAKLHNDLHERTMTAYRFPPPLMNTTMLHFCITF